jgi:hypothetical protein
VARDIEVPPAQRTDGENKGKGAALPCGMEHRYDRLGLDGTEAHHAAQIMRAVHAGALARPVPIIESRVTSSDRRSSLQPSVPAGRSGITR